jgi:hypothetical protein
MDRRDTERNRYRKRGKVFLEIKEASPNKPDSISTDNTIL